MKSLTAFALIAFCAIVVDARPATAARRNLDSSALMQLSILDPGKTLTIDAFPVGPANVAAIHFKRVPIYASDAHIYVETATGRIELPHSDRIFLRGYSDDGSARVALALNADSSFAHGSGSGPQGQFLLHGSTKAGASNLVAQKMEPPKGLKFDFRCAGDIQGSDFSSLNDAATRLQAALAAQATSSVHALRFAVVAIDTDSLFMSRLFSNDTTQATNWIAGMFNTMNLMYERDLLVQLQIGMTILRTSSGTDPYIAFTPGASTAELDTFAGYWKTNESAVTRAFTILLSGAISSTQFGCSTSGLAWVNQYCQKGFVQNTDTVGSYSVDQVCTSIDIDPDGSFDALLVGHEIGHNFGAYHTHCSNATTGVPTGSNFIDQCFSGESVIYNNNPEVCYSGTTSCPAAGAGTIMSYCNFNTSGCAAGTQDLLEFNSVQATTLLGYIGAQPSNCLNSTDDIFFSLFE